MQTVYATMRHKDAQDLANRIQEKVKYWPYTPTGRFEVVIPRKQKKRRGRLRQR